MSVRRHKQHIVTEKRAAKAMKFLKKLEPVKLGDYEFYCEGCKKVQLKSAYCVAQQAMNYEVEFTCPDCKFKMLVPQ